MCGIAGILSGQADKMIRHDTLKKMTDTIVHRGPDGEGHWTNDAARVGFGHRRLSIIDLSEKGKQPMHYMGRYTITFNGEIYNYQELKTELLKSGYNFVSESDTEVLLALFDNKGEQCLSQLDGMFAFAIWDEKLQRLFCARDRFGEKPFYYCIYKGDFYFASEMKQLWAAGVPRTFVKHKFEKFIDTGDVYFGDTDGTFYEGIKQLQAAHTLTLDFEMRPEIKSYWRLIIPETPLNIKLNDAIAEWESLFTTSLLRRMRSDVTVGSSLSGGLDSSYIVALICSHQKNNINSFSATFPGFERDESEYIDAVVNHVGKINSYKVTPTGEDLLNDFSKLADHQEEPFQSASIYAQYKVFELARKHNTIVLIDGQGADELLGGYLPYYEDYLRQLFFWNRREYRKQIQTYGAIHGDYAPVRDYADQENLRMKIGRIKQKISGAERAYPKTYLKQRLVNDLCGQPLQTLLRYADRDSMAHSVEVRLPFLNHTLAEWVVKLPDSLFLNEGWFKVLLRNSADQYLPEKVVWRKRKVGYEPPQKNWLHTEPVKQKINEARKIFGAKRPEDEAAAGYQDWRLLMAKYLV